MCIFHKLSALPPQTGVEYLESIETKQALRIFEEKFVGNIVF